MNTNKDGEHSCINNNCGVKQSKGGVELKHLFQPRYSNYTLNYQEFMKMFIWLVVLTIMKNMSQWEGLSHILWKKTCLKPPTSHCSQDTQNQWTGSKKFTTERTATCWDSDANSDFAYGVSPNTNYGCSPNQNNWIVIILYIILMHRSSPPWKFFVLLVLVGGPNWTLVKSPFCLGNIPSKRHVH